MPTSEQIKQARLAAGLTQGEAMALLGKTTATAYRTWQNWERGTHTMPTEKWELFKIKLNSRS